MRRLSLLSLIVIGIAVASCSHSASTLPFSDGKSTPLTPLASSPSSKYTMLYAFKGGRDGDSPTQDLVQSSPNPLIYGTTYGGGGGNKYGECAKGCGTIYSIDPTSRKESVVYRFKGLSAGDGAIPEAGLSSPPGGTVFFGTTFFGGVSGKGCYSARGCGTVYELTIGPKSATERVLYAFKGGADGANPLGGVRLVKGVIWGTTEYGGKYGLGTVFTIPTPSSERTSGARNALSDKVVHTFAGAEASPSDGAYPNGNLGEYGTLVVGVTLQGGGNNVGTIFEITTSGVEKTLYSFSQAVGDYPVGLVHQNNGPLFGAASSDGADKRGSIFMFDPTTNVFKIVHSFRGFAKSDGALPYSRPQNYYTSPPAGTVLFGTTQGGGTNGNGTIYRIEEIGQTGKFRECTIHSFGPAATDGLRPDATTRLIGNLYYGTTVEGGSTKDGVGLGTIYAFAPQPCSAGQAYRVK